MLFAMVSQVTGYGLTYLHRILFMNDTGHQTKLTNINTLNTLSQELGIEVTDLLEEAENG